MGKQNYNRTQLILERFYWGMVGEEGLDNPSARILEKVLSCISC